MIAPSGEIARIVVLDGATFDDAARANGHPPTLASFTRNLKRALKDAEVRPSGDMELSAALEAFMKLAKHRLEVVPRLLEPLVDAMESPESARAALQPAREFCETVIAVAVWLRNADAPDWMFHRLEATTAFQLMSRIALEAEDLRLALHWATALLVSPTTRLARGADARVVADRTDIERVVRILAELGAAPMKEEIEAWHDLYSCYRLFD